MRLESVNVAAVLRTEAWNGRMGRSGIDKRPAAGPVVLTPDGVTGDVVVDRRFHGGVDKAAYAYSVEDAAWWSAELDREVGIGAFGENLTTSGLDVSGALIGERWRIGDAELEVSGPRTPCRVFAGYWGVPDLVRRFTLAARTGAYLRVLVEGPVRAGDPITVVHRPDHGVTVRDAFRAVTTEPGLLPRLVGLPGLSEEIATQAARRLRRTRTAPPPDRDAGRDAERTAGATPRGA